MVRRVDDLKSAIVLSGALAIGATVTVPLLLPRLPPESRSLPLPLPLFCAVPKLSKEVSTPANEKRFQTDVVQNPIKQAFFSRGDRI